MPGEKLPWFPFYFLDFHNDEKVKLMGPATRYIYIMLLSHQWQEGSLPSDRQSIQRLIDSIPKDWQTQEQIDAMLSNDLTDHQSGHLFDYDAVISQIVSCFELQNDRLVNKRLSEIRNRQVKTHIAREKGAEKSREKLKNHQSDHQSGHQTDHQGKNQNQNQNHIKTFVQFWQAYPKKKAKADAIKAWNKISHQNGLVEQILSAVRVQSQSEDWIKEKGKYIPLPASWLNGKRWEDELVTPLNKKSEPGLSNPNFKGEPGT